MRISFRKKILPGVYLGFSKSLFKFKKNRGNKQESLEDAKAKFLKNNYEEFNNLLVDYFAAKGEFITPDHAMSQFVEGEVRDIYTRFSGVMEAVALGGNLTNHRVDTVAVCKCALKAVIDGIECKDPLFDKVRTIRELEGKSKKYLKYAIIACITLYGIPLGAYFFIKRYKALEEKLRILESIQEQIRGKYGIT